MSMTAQPLPELAQIPHTIASVNDYEPYARERLSESAWAYFSGGAADEYTLQDNLASFTRYGLWPAALASLENASTQTELLGQTLPYPIMLAPIAYQAMAHPQGELGTVLAAGAMQAHMVVSMQASFSIEQIAAQAHGPLWLQWYWQSDKAFMLDLLGRAQASGYQAIVFTVDAPVNGVRNREQRAAFCLPEHIQAVNLRGSAQPVSVQGAAGTSPLFGSGLLKHAPTWDDLLWLIQHSPLPVVLKGIMRPADVLRAQQVGVAAVIVSNHGGRTLDTAPASLDALAAVVQNATVPVLFDGGIRRGTDIVKALALGAKAVLIGRPYLYALAAAGPRGVAHVLHILRAELEVAMALCGCAQLADIGPHLLYRPELPR